MSDDIPYHRLASQFYNRPLLLQASSAETISAYLLSRIGGGSRSGAAGSEAAGKSYEVFNAKQRPDGSFETHSPRTSRFYGDVPLEDGGRPAPFRRTADGVAIITLIGEFVNRGAWVGAESGLISYEGVKHQMLRAGADAKTKSIILDIESPGGEGIGCFEAAAVVREVAVTKPVVAVVNGIAFSAAYALASGASRIVILPTGMSGSIGVVWLHLDFSQMLADAGVKPTFLFAGAHKVDGNQFEPLPDDVRTDIQVEIDGFYAQFVDTVAAGRSGLSDAAIRETEARVYKGQEAVDVGLVDDVGTFEEVLADLSNTSLGASATYPTMKGSKMSKQVGEPAADAGQSTPETKAPATVASLAAAHPDLVAQIRADAAAAESARIAGIESHALPGHEQLVAEMKADGKTTPDQAAGRILQAEKAKGGQHLQALKDADAAAGVVKPAATAPGKPVDKATADKTDAELEADWNGTPELRAEFTSAKAYAAFAKAEAAGEVRFLRGREERAAS